MASQNGKPNVVLVHGAWVDGSGWEGVYKILRKDGYNVSIVQNSTSTFSDDVQATNRVIEAQEGPVMLVGRCCQNRSSQVSGVEDDH